MLRGHPWHNEKCPHDGGVPLLAVMHNVDTKCGGSTLNICRHAFITVGGEGGAMG